MCPVAEDGDRENNPIRVTDTASSIADIPPAPLPRAVATTDEPQPLHGDVGVRRFFTLHSTATIFPLTAGLILFGWRALFAVLLVLAGAFAGFAVWRRIGMRGRRMGVSRGVWYA